MKKRKEVIFYLLPDLLWVSALCSERKFQYFGTRTWGSGGCSSTHQNWMESVNLKVRESVSPNHWNCQPLHNVETQKKTSS